MKEISGNAAARWIDKSCAGGTTDRTKMKVHSKDFRVGEGDEVDLKKWPTSVKPAYKSKEQYQKLLEEHVGQLSQQQQLLYASNRHFWRTTRDLPQRGRIGIFNRSYYEEVLIARVHPKILRSEAIPDTPHHDRKVWRDRYRSIVDLEKHLHRNGTRIVKFFLHISKEEQRKRFLARIDEPEKNWKFSLADVAERRFWDQYMTAFEECLGATSTRHAPWYVVPSDDKENARLAVSRIVLDTFKGLEMTYPKTSKKRRKELLSIRRRLAA